MVPVAPVMPMMRRMVRLPAAGYSDGLRDVGHGLEVHLTILVEQLEQRTPEDR